MERQVKHSKAYLVSIGKFLAFEEFQQLNRECWNYLETTSLEDVSTWSTAQYNAWIIRLLVVIQAHVAWKRTQVFEQMTLRNTVKQQCHHTATDGGGVGGGGEPFSQYVCNLFQLSEKQQLGVASAQVIRSHPFGFTPRMNRWLDAYLTEIRPRLLQSLRQSSPERHSQVRQHRTFWLVPHGRFSSQWFLRQVKQVTTEVLNKSFTPRDLRFYATAYVQQCRMSKEERHLWIKQGGHTRATARKYYSMVTSIEELIDREQPHKMTTYMMGWVDEIHESDETDESSESSKSSESMESSESSEGIEF